MTKPVKSHVMALSAWTLKKAHIISLSPDYNYLHATGIPHIK